MTKKSYAVGYGKPPLHSRFKPGRSGNPKGRPKGARGFGAELDEVLNETIMVTENGEQRRMRKQMAIIKTVVAKALKGDTKSVQLILNQSDNQRGNGTLQADDLDAVDELILEAYRQQQGKKA